MISAFVCKLRSLYHISWFCSFGSPPSKIPRSAACYMLGPGEFRPRRLFELSSAGAAICSFQFYLASMLPEPPHYGRPRARPSCINRNFAISISLLCGRKRALAAICLTRRRDFLLRDVRFSLEMDFFRRVNPLFEKKMILIPPLRSFFID